MCANKCTVVIESGYLAAVGSLFLDPSCVTSLPTLRVKEIEENLTCYTSEFLGAAGEPTIPSRQHLR